MLRWITPHYRVERVEELTPERLRRLEIDAVLVDVDCTLKRFRSDELSPTVGEWIDDLKREGIGFCLASNGGAHRIRPFAKQLDVPFVARALKPLPFLLKQMVRRLGFTPQRTAMVGDQVFADVIAGLLAGMQTFLVTPIHPEDEPWLTRLKRPLERGVQSRTSLYDWGDREEIEEDAARQSP